MTDLRSRYPEHRQLLVVASLAFATLVCLALFVARLLYVGRLAHQGMIWNLFLAWLPMLSSLVVYNLTRRSGRSRWPLIGICAGLWLLFFPNAPYILTDLMHLRPLHGVPLWFDLIMLLAMAWTGLFLGLVSLYLMQALVRRAAGARASWLFVLAVLGLTGFGVYLGRFPRYNSWDVFVDPLSLLADIALRLRNPFDYPGTFVFSGLFSVVLFCVYLMLAALMQFHRDEPAG